MSRSLSTAVTSDSIPMSASHSLKKSMVVIERFSSGRAMQPQRADRLPSGIVRSPSGPFS